MATRCSHGHRPLIFLITLLFSVLTVSYFIVIFLINYIILSKGLAPCEFVGKGGGGEGGKGGGGAPY